MKKTMFIFVITAMVLLFCSCSSKEIINAGNKPKTSSVADKNIDFSAPAAKENGIKKIGEEVKDETLNGIYLSYKITDARIYNTPEQAGLKKNNILTYEDFYDENGKFDTDYKLLLVSVDVYCEKKQNNTDYRPNITRLSSVGVTGENGVYTPVSTEQIYFSDGKSERTTNSKDYFYYEINEDETLSVKCGWIIPQKLKTEDMYLSIGSVAYSTDGSVNDDSAYISLNKED